MHTLFFGKRKYSCQLTVSVAQLDHTSDFSHHTLPKCNFLSTSLEKKQKKTERHDVIRDEKFVHQNQILSVIHTQMCVIGNTELLTEGSVLNS